MRTYDRLALARALQTGYLVEDTDVSFIAHECWYLHCCEEGLPCTYILGHHPQRTVVLDTESVAEHYAAQGEPLAQVPLLTPTEKTRAAVQRLVRRYAQPREQAKVGSYTVLYGVWASSAEEVARELLAVWEQARVFVNLSSLWDEQSRGVAV